MGIRYLATLAIVCTTMACGNRSGDSPHLPPAYEDVSPLACEQSGINGRWQLVATKRERKSYAVDENIEMYISNCSHITYSTNGRSFHADSFQLLRVIRYCNDYQLRYLHTDSINCLDIVRDTLIIGACNNYSETRYVYKRLTN